MGFKLLETGTRRNEPRITFTKSKYIRFNPSFIIDNELKEKNYVRIYINKKESETLIGFEFLNEKKEKSLKLTKIEQDNGAFCSGNSLYSELELKQNEMEKSIQFSPIEEKFEGKKLFVIKFHNNKGTLNSRGN